MTPANGSPLPALRRDSTWIGLLALAFWAIAIGAAVSTEFGGDERALLRLGTAFEHPRELRDAPRFRGDGYDGQFFAALATDPLLLRPETPRMFDAPVYRASRAGLPLAAWLLAAGDGRRAVLLYQLLSWVLGATVVWVVARWLEHEGRSAWWAAPLVASPGLLTSFMQSMPDPAALTLAVAALFRERTGRRGAVALLVAAVLVRDMMILAALGVAVAAFRDGRRRDAAWFLGLPIVAVLAWKAYVLSRFGMVGLDVPGGNFGLPFAWLPAKLAKAFDAPEVLALCSAGLSVLAGLTLLPRALRAPPVVLTYLAFAVLALFLSGPNYLVIWWGYARTLLPLAVLALPVSAVTTTGRGRLLFAASTWPWAAVTALVIPRWFLGLAVAVAALAAVLWLVRGRSRQPTA